MFPSLSAGALSIGGLGRLGRDCESERLYGNKSEVIGSLPEARMDTLESSDSAVPESGKQEGDLCCKLLPRALPSPES